MKSVLFSTVPVGGFFKEREGGPWHLKTGRNRATYQASGVRGEPQFSASETVFVEAIPEFVHG